MIYFLIGAGIVVVALCMHYSTSSYGNEEASLPPASSGADLWALGWNDNLARYGTGNDLDWGDRETDDPITDPAYSSLSCNIFYDDID